MTMHAPQTQTRQLVPPPSSEVEATAAALNGNTQAVTHLEATIPNLYQRINAVRLALGGTISKNGQAPQVMGGFRFVAWDDVAEKVGTLMAQNGIVMLPSMPECDVVHAGTTANGKPIYRATVNLVYELINADEPRDRTSVTWVGSGDDSGDKAIQKAATSGSKYLLLKLFMLGGADDSEANGEESRVDRPADTTDRLQPQGQRQRPPVRQVMPPATSEKPRMAGDVREGDPCLLCSEAQASGVDVKAGKYRLYRGRLQCTGKVNGEWVNHPAPSGPSLPNADLAGPVSVEPDELGTSR